MKRLFAALVVLALTLPAWASSFTLELTDVQIKTIAVEYEQAPDKGKYPDPESWFSAQVSGQIQIYANRQAKEQAVTFCQAFVAQPQGEQDAICTSLGLSKPCSCK